MGSRENAVHHGNNSTPQPFPSRGEVDIYGEPSDFSNIDEARFGDPVRNGNEAVRGHRESYLEDAEKEQNGQDDDIGLSEVAGPPPAENESPPRESSPVEGHNPSSNEAQNGHVKENLSTTPPAADVTGLKHTVPAWLTKLYTVSYLVFFSMMGTLARLGVQWLTFYPGTPVVTPVIWANFGGSLVMGFLAEDQALFRDEWLIASAGIDDKLDVTKLDKGEKSKRKKTIPIYIGLAVGFCGSFTSFSSFARDFFLALSNDLPTPVNHSYLGPSTHPSPSSTVSRNGGYSFMAFLAVVAMTVALSLGGLNLGAHIALVSAPYMPKLPIKFIRRIADPLFVIIGFGCWLGAVFLAIWPPDRPSGPASRGSWDNEVWRGQAIFALVFAPLGCLLRFYVSIKLNARVPAFPIGTFAVNMLGTAIEAMCYDLQRVTVGSLGLVGGGIIGCQVLQGVQDGFCGCLTTVSTWVAEINGLRRRKGYVYGFASVAVAFGLMVVIMGSVRWSIGWNEVVCNTGYTSKVH